ncbi:MAG: Fic family protein [Candidatus Zapsychrus exili]|nr:Fic family protein [Candidatus Zapsychrus exili]
MNPPYTITKEILKLCEDIFLMLGKYEGLALPTPKPQLRKHTKIVTIHSSLAIEGNTLSVDQVTDIINNKKVVGPKKDILEVKNAIKAYDLLDKYEPESLESLLNAHKVLMDGLVDNPGKLRKVNVGVGGEGKIIHMAPKFTMVPELMNNLFSFMKEEKDLTPLIKSSIFHYEFEFIHPFIDGNGRIGRLWQSVMLYNYREIFAYIPIETIIRRRQMEYYEALQESTKQGESTAFIKYMLEIIKEAALELTKKVRPSNQQTEIRLDLAKEHFKDKEFNRGDYLRIHNNISPTSATRDLAIAVEKEVLEKNGELNKRKYKFIPETID